MVINSEVLEKKINQYFNNEINKTDLGLWAMEAYYALMKGEYIEIEKLQIYHFLRKISTFHTVPDDIAGEYPCSEEEVLEIEEILSGRKNINYTFNIKIFRNIYQSEIYKLRLEKFQELEEVIDGISSDSDDISSSVVDKLIKYANQEVSEVQSLIDLFEIHIKGIIVENINFEEKILNYRQSVGIYVGNVNKKNFIPDLKRLLKCVMGDMYFRISIIYNKGTPCLCFVLQ